MFVRDSSFVEKHEKLSERSSKAGQISRLRERNPKNRMCAFKRYLLILAAMLPSDADLLPFPPFVKREKSFQYHLWTHLPFMNESRAEDEDEER